MTTLTVNIDNKKAEKAIKAVLDALGLNYNIEQNVNSAKQNLNEEEQRVYNNLKRSFTKIKMHKEGKIKLQNAKDAISEIEASLKD
ncbi:hypothetical protein HDC92_001809 [Pedobacter sp. AK017]|uniref:hypothetical protein n=1 Tax=Pedobacter sp. AK017 TaxID=2723073 RepID=UPI00160AE6FA|nr:hypothetical protein [Pedobacter sp. AK017]MBB5438134.1 hypothetical protein [Pedobacter sp. AK017]